MKFLRVCKQNLWTVGMYHGVGGAETWANVHLNYDHKRHPMPHDDPGLSERWEECEYRGYLFAFPGVMELKKWIYDPAFYQHLAREDYYPHWITAEGYHGWYQSIFDPRTVTSVQMWKWEEI
jgi:hypothetical protein